MPLDRTAFIVKIEVERSFALACESKQAVIQLVTQTLDAEVKEARNVYEKLIKPIKIEISEVNVAY